MKLTQTNSSILQSIRQPTQLEAHDSLVFVYPFLIDKNLDRQYGKLLRDFLTCQFTAQIKTSNVLNIMVKASNAGSNNQNLDKLENAAERTVQDTTLGLLTPADQIPRPNLSSILKQNYQDQQKYEYENKIAKFKEYIYDQIKNDPQYTDLNILISNITIENLLDIPLILGTKSKTVNSLPLFWILLAASGQYRSVGDQANSVIRMDRTQSFDLISRAIRSVNINNYEQLLHVNKLIPPKITTKNNRIDNLLSGIRDELDKAINDFKGVTNESRFNEDVGISQKSSLSVTNILQSSLTTQKNINTKAITLFSSLLSNYIVPIVQSVTNSIVTTDEVNVANRINILINNLLTSTSEQYTSLNTQVTQGLQQETDDQTGNMLDRFQGMCKSNASISVTKVLQELSNARFKITGTRESFIDFVEAIIKISNQLNTYRSNLENQLVDLANESEYVRDELKQFGNSNVGLLSGFMQTIRHLVNDVDNNGDLKRNRELDRTVGTVVRIFQEYFQKDMNTNELYTKPENAPLLDPGNLNNRLSTMINGPRVAQTQEQLNQLHRQNIVFINNIITALTNITVFFAYYTFFSYLCEFIQEINATVQSQKKDVLDFPNYCLVVNKTVIEALYMSLAALNYSNPRDNDNNNAPPNANAIRKLGPYERPSVPTKGLNLQDIKEPYINEPNETKNIYTNFKVSETSIENMIRTLNTKLCIPNIIVVDDKSNSVYYHWMYSGSAILKLSISTIQNYVTHQKQALSKL